jgi:hypothetical protein
MVGDTRHYLGIGAPGTHRQEAPSPVVERSIATSYIPTHRHAGAGEF